MPFRSARHLILVACCCAVVPGLGATCGGPPRPAPPPETGNLPPYGVAAHRGASATHPENTLAAFAEAVRLGAHQVQLDVRATRDQQLVVMHDATVDRTTNGRGAVRRLDLAQIKKLDAGRWKHERFRGERVPTLAEALDAMPEDIWINIHVRNDEFVAEEVAILLVDKRRVAQAIVAAGADAAEVVRRVDPAIKICDMTRGRSRQAYMDHVRASNAHFIQFSSRRGLPEREQVEELARSGVRVNYCCPDPTVVLALFHLGVQFPMVDDVAGALRAAAEFGIAPRNAPAP